MRAAALALVLTAAAALTSSGQAPAATSFAQRIAALSEPGGYFDTDNLISNERSYLHVTGALDGLQGGAYIGVGPDQNFSYIARVRPEVALIVDIRRDNLLLHLLFKALFAVSPGRVDYLSNLTGRAPPSPSPAWTAADIQQLVAQVDRAPALEATGRARLATRLDGLLSRMGVPLSVDDLATIRRFHDRFIDEGLSLQFNSTGRPPQWGYPTYRDLLLETDRQGVRRNFLASETDYHFLRRLQADDRVIPVVGDLAGGTAMPAIARFLERQGTRLAAIYTSNVEFYLFRQGAFGRFAENVIRLPATDDAVIIRSVFGGAPVSVVPGYNSASVVQPVADFGEAMKVGAVRRYPDLIARSR